MGSIAKCRKRQLGMLAAALVATAWAPTAWALPSDNPSISQTNGVEDASVVKSDDNRMMDITMNRSKAIIDWEKFGIAQNEEVNFKTGDDTNPGWMVLNRVTGAEKSVIDGILNGQDGTVFLVNTNGITFGENARVDVGSLVASTLAIKNEDFLNENFTFSNVNDENKNYDGCITVNNLANIKATDGYVAILAHEIENSGTIEAHDVALAAGQKITLGYDDKINLSVNVEKGTEPLIIDTAHNYVLMSARDAEKDVVGSLIKNNGIIKATGISRSDKGEIILTAAKVRLNTGSKLEADGGRIVTSGADDIRVSKGASIHSVSADGQTAGDWNIIGKLVTVDENIKTGKSNTVDNAVLGNSLRDTNVHIISSPIKTGYYADVHIDGEINKTDGLDTKLDITAGRNICVDADIKSTGGKLNVLLAGDSNKTLGTTNSERGDGANVIRANIETNGGDFETYSLHGKDEETGKEYLANGTYFGVKDKSEAGKVDRHIYTKGGNINLGGAEVLVATGNEVVLDTTDAETGAGGKVTIEGMVNSANFYRAGDTEKNMSWARANEKANDVEPGKSHLAVITSALEDAITNSTLNVDFSKSQEAYVGGHVVAVETNEDDSIKLGADGLPIAKKDDKGNVVTIVNEKTNTKDGEERLGGWYVKSRDDVTGKPTYARYWAWTVGEEAGTIIYEQTTGENVAVDTGFSNKPDKKNDKNGDVCPGFHDMPEPGTDPSKYDKNSQEYKWLTEDHGVKLNNAYVNFAPGEPNDGGGRTEGSETALAVNHDTYFDKERGNVLVSKWDDMPDGSNPTRPGGHTTISTYVVETEIGKSSLRINAGETLLKDKVGNLSKLNDLTIDSSANITAKDSVQVVNNVVATAAIDNNFEQFIAADKGQVYLSAGNDITTDAVKAADLVGLNAGRDVTINGIIESQAKDTDSAVEIMAQRNFYNKVEDGANALKVGENSHWKIYSNSPYDDDFGGLNSNQFAEWGWSGKTTTAGTGNLYIFKYNPTLKFTADNGGEREEGTSMNPVGYIYENEMDGKFLNAFLDGYNVLFMNREGMKDATTVAHKINEDGMTVDESTDGYSAEAAAGDYKTLMANHEAAKQWGYKVETESGKLSITAKQEEPQQEEPNKDEPKQDEPQQEEPKQDEPKQDEPQQDEPQQDEPQQDEPQQDEPQQDEPQQDEPQQDEPEQGVTKRGEPQQEESKHEETQQEELAPASNTKQGEKPQLEQLNTTSLGGTASIIEAKKAQANGVDRVLGLQSAELPFFNEKRGKVSLYGTYDVSVDPDKVKMEPTAKVLPEPDQPKNQYRELVKEIATEEGSAKFHLTYNGSTLDIYPTDEAATALLLAGDDKKNVEVESKALFTAFNHMGITLDDLDGVYTHFGSMKASSLANKPSKEAAAIIKDIKGRSGAFKIAECDDGIVMDAVALMVCPDDPIGR